MLKILFESSIFLHQEIGGISKYIINLNENLNKKNIHSTIYSPLTINNYLNKKRKNNIFFFRFKKIPKFSRKVFFIINNFLTFFYIKIYKPDIIHFSYYNESLLNYINIPYILTVYDLIHEKLNLKQNQFKKKKLIDNAEHIICISEQTKQDLLRYYKVNQKNISVIYLGADNFKKVKKEKKKKKFILYVGDRSRYKNFFNLINAYNRSKYLKKNFQIVCFGGGQFNEEEVKIFQKYKISKKIIYKTGNDELLNKTYKEASLFVSVSLLEGFGLTPLEAIKLGCPVVCSKIKVFRETLKNSCIYVDPKKINDIKNGLEKVLKSKIMQKKLVARGKQRIKKFTWQNCAYSTAKIYNEILKR